MRRLSLACFSLLLSLSFTLVAAADPKKAKCGDLDIAFWDFMHKLDLCEAKKLPKKLQCGEGRKKCGVPGSYCDDGVCSTACGAGKPKCPDGFHCENGECDDHEIELDKTSPPTGSTEKHRRPASTTCSEEGCMTVQVSQNCADGNAKCSERSPCVNDKCKGEVFHQSRTAAEGPYIDMKAPKKSTNGTSVVSDKDMGNQTNGSAKSIQKKLSPRTKPATLVVPVSDQQTLSEDLAPEFSTEEYGLCNVFRRPDVVCKLENETCVQYPREECVSEKTGCSKLADEPGICIGTCHGFLGRQCGTGLQCIDDPRDDCDPQRGGSDCMGICVEEKWPEMKQDGSWMAKKT